MTDSSAGDRRRILDDLLRLQRHPIEWVVAQIRQLSWDYPIELVTLTRAIASDRLQDFREKRLSAGHFELWAEAIEMREDIGLEPGHEEILGQFLQEAANPALFRPITDAFADDWLRALAGPLIL